MYIIRLNNLAFKSPLGVFDEEKKLGTDILINLSVSLANLPTTTTQYLDYSRLFELVHSATKQPFDLLEELASHIISELFTCHTDLKQVDIHICKLFPPIPGCRGNIEIKLSQTRS